MPHQATHPSFYIDSLIQDCIEELKNQSINPPANDAVIKPCYTAFLDLLQDNPTHYRIFNVLQEKHYTPAHFVNILFRAVQFIELYHRGDNNYPYNFDTTAKWREELLYIFQNKFEILEQVLLTKDTTTTIYQRYAGPKIILNAFFPKTALSVADLGCGGNYGLPGLLKNKPFETVIDHTSKSVASSFLIDHLNIVEALAVDKENPYDAESKKWRFACSFYPQELISTKNELPIFDENETVFEKIDLTNAENFPEKYNIKTNNYDAVIMSTFLYQLNPTQIQQVIHFAKNICKKNGVVIIQDFAEIDQSDRSNLHLFKSWFSIPYPYRTFITGRHFDWQLKEILRWDSGRCKSVSNGEDFQLLFS